MIVGFFFNDTATTEIYTLSLHDALPILHIFREGARCCPAPTSAARRLTSPIRAAGSPHVAHCAGSPGARDRKSTRLNSSHANISYAVFCLKKKTPSHPPPA